MIPAILIWRDGHETEQSVEPGPDIRVSGTSFHRVGMQRSRFLYVEVESVLRAVPSAEPERAS